MYRITDRVAFLRNEAVNVKKSYEKIEGVACVLNTFGLLDADKALSNEEKIAVGMENTMLKSAPYIFEGELLVGYNYGSDEYMSRDNEANRAKLRRSGFSDEQTERFYSHGKDICMHYNAGTPMIEQEQQLQDEWAAIGRCIDANHSVINYEAVLEYGFSGLYEKVCEFERKNGKSDLYNAAKIICKAAMTFGEKYSREAQRLAETAEPKRKAELLKIAEVCKNVPANPARSFHEALQSLWFAHIFNTWEDHINANSLGRLDRILYPYYKKDIESGNISREYAFELLCCLWIKLYRDYDVQQSCVGGCDEDGNDSTNELSHMMLDATERLDFVRCLSVRYSQKTSRDFLKRALEVVGHGQKGVPFFFNDDVMIPALENAGIATADARDYTQIGCVETVIPGKSNPHAVTGETNLLKALEYALNNGVSIYDESRSPGLPTGDISDFRDYDSLVKAVKKQIEHILHVTCKRIVCETEKSVVNSPKPYKSLLTSGCIETNRDFNNHGALYDYYQVMLGGIPNLADSLAVIKKFCFETKKYTLSDIVYQLKNNYPDEVIRLEFLNKAPKFGNDIDEVDRIAVSITDYACDILEKFTKEYGYSFHAQPFTFLWMIHHGAVSAASPDGRRKGEPIAYSVSPMQGRDFNGFTALLNSISKFPTKRTPGTTSAIVEVDPLLFTDRNIDRFVDIMLAAGRKGLSNIQFNITDAETLRDAQMHPEKYNNLAVRVSGFSQKFNLIDKKLQNHIIERTKHQCF